MELCILINIICFGVDRRACVRACTPVSIDNDFNNNQFRSSLSHAHFRPKNISNRMQWTKIICFVALEFYFRDHYRLCMNSVVRVKCIYMYICIGCGASFVLNGFLLSVGSLWVVLKHVIYLLFEAIFVLPVFGVQFYIIFFFLFHRLCCFCFSCIIESP